MALSMGSRLRTFQRLVQNAGLLKSGTACGSAIPNCNEKHIHSSGYTKTIPGAQYGGRHTVTLMPGDGVGPELLSYVREIFRYTGVPVDFETIELDHKTSDEDYEDALLAIKRNGVALKGNVETDFDKVGFKSRNLELRAELDLFANIVHCRTIQGVPTRHQDIDLVIIRENTEGEYSQLEHENVGGVVESLKIITKQKSTKIARYAFEYAREHGRKKVTAVHKANIMKLSDGLFLECCKTISEEYPEIEFENMIVDNCSMQMVSRPQQFDVLVLPNLYGNIIANIGAGLVGGPGVVSGTNIGDKYAIFETGTRNTGVNIMGKNIANPSAMLLASADMLEHLGLVPYAKTIKDAVYNVMQEEKTQTRDLGGHASTSEVIQEIISYIQTSGSPRS